MIRIKCKHIIVFLLLFVVLLALACSPASLSGYKPMTVKDNVNSEIPLNMEVWKNGVIHIEATDNIQSVKDRIRMTESDLLQSKGINWGTALLIKHLNRYFLVTSRQVIYDREAGANYLQESGSNITPTWSDDFKKDD